MHPHSLTSQFSSHFQKHFNPPHNWDRVALSSKVNQLKTIFWAPTWQPNDGALTIVISIKAFCFWLEKKIYWVQCTRWICWWVLLVSISLFNPYFVTKCWFSKCWVNVLIKCRSLYICLWGELDVFS